MGLIITVGITTKGGVGKSTIATNLAVDLSREEMKFNTKVFDTDIENTASFDFFESRKQNTKAETLIECDLISDLEGIKEAIEYAEASDFNIAIIDVAGMNTDVTASAVSISDLLYIPFRMSSKDLKALGTFVEYINNAKEGGASMECILVPNYIYANAHVSKIKTQLKPLTENGFTFGSGLKNRNSYINAPEEGLSVTEYGDKKAGAEIRLLVDLAIKRFYEGTIENEK